MSSRDGLIARWIRKARRVVLKWTLFLSLFNLLCWTWRCSPLSLRRWPALLSDNSLGRVVVFVRLNWLLLISFADLGLSWWAVCLFCCLPLPFERKQKRTDVVRCLSAILLCEADWDNISPLICTVSAVDASCLVASLVAGWLRAIAVSGFSVAWVARHRLFLCLCRPLATN